MSSAIAKGLVEMEKALTKPVYDGPRIKWLKLADKQTALIRFINELGADSPHYDPSRDLAIIVKEHTHPTDYRKKAVCTMESEGRCFGCEMQRKMTEEERKKGYWYGKYRLYINCLVNDELEDPYVAVWSQATGEKSASWNTLKAYFKDTGSISNRWWKIQRQGEGKMTTYPLVARDPDTEPFDWTGIEPFDLSLVYRDIPYAEQEAYYLGFDSAPSSETKNLDW